MAKRLGVLWTLVVVLVFLYVFPVTCAVYFRECNKRDDLDRFKFLLYGATGLAGVYGWYMMCITPLPEKTWFIAWAAPMWTISWLLQWNLMIAKQKKWRIGLYSTK